MVTPGPRATRTIGSGPRAGAEVDVAVATHVTGVLEQASGALSTLMMSFDVWAGRLPYLAFHVLDVWKPSSPRPAQVAPKTSRAVATARRPSRSARPDGPSTGPPAWPELWCPRAGY
jgi:hypothetical protein